MVEGTPLLREHTGQNLYPGFESLRLRQFCSVPTRSRCPGERLSGSAMRSFGRLAFAALALPAFLVAMPAAGAVSGVDKPALKVGDDWVHQRSQTRPPAGAGVGLYNTTTMELIETSYISK